MTEAEPEILEGQPCAYCKTNNLTLTQLVREVPYFGEVLVFSMTCTNCKFHKADVECTKQKGKVKYTLEISSKEDLNVRVIKGAEATVKIPRIGDIRPGIASQGYITNVEGILRRMKMQIESLRDSAE